MKREEEESGQLRGEKRCLSCIAAAAITEDAWTLRKFLQTSQEFFSSRTFQAARPRPTPWFAR